jgi:hypothetical protein
MALPEIKPVTRKWAWAYMADVSADASAYTVSPCRGRIVSARSVLYGQISGADAGIQVAINGTSVTGLALVIANSGSAAGDMDVAYPTALSTTYVNEGDTITFDSDGASSTTAAMMLMVEIEQD